jgi:hypothetical protein
METVRQIDGSWKFIMEGVFPEGCPVPDQIAIDDTFGGISIQWWFGDRVDLTVRMNKRSVIRSGILDTKSVSRVCCVVCFGWSPTYGNFVMITEPAKESREMGSPGFLMDFLIAALRTENARWADWKSGPAPDAVSKERFDNAMVEAADQRPGRSLRP